MAIHPWEIEKNFETGAENGTRWEEFGAAATDTDNILDVAHYPTLVAEHPTEPGAIPWSGAYCGRIQMGTGTNDAFFNEADDTDAFIANDTAVFRFRIYIGNSATATSADDVTILRFNSAGPDDPTVGLHFAANGDVNFHANGVDGNIVAKGQWYTVDGLIEIAAGAGTDDGSTTIYVTPDNGWSGTTVYATATSQDNDVWADLDFGIGDKLGTTTGLILLDNLVVNEDSNRFHASPNRYSNKQMLTAPGHLFVGPGTIKNLTLISGANTANSGTGIALYDTDVYRINDSDNRVAQYFATAASETFDPPDVPIKFRRGCYIDFIDGDGTSVNFTTEVPRVLCELGHVNAWGSQGAVRSYGARRPFGG